MPSELDDFLARHPETRFLDAVMFDLCGTAIGKRYPIRDAAKVWSSAWPSAPGSRRSTRLAPAGM